MIVNTPQGQRKEAVKQIGKQFGKDLLVQMGSGKKMRGGKTRRRDMRHLPVYVA